MIEILIVSLFLFDYLLMNLFDVMSFCHITVCLSLWIQARIQHRNKLILKSNELKIFVKGTVGTFDDVQTNPCQPSAKPYTSICHYFSSRCSNIWRRNGYLTYYLVSREMGSTQLICMNVNTFECKGIYIYSRTLSKYYFILVTTIHQYIIKGKLFDLLLWHLNTLSETSVV